MSANTKRIAAMAAILLGCLLSLWACAPASVDMPSPSESPAPAAAPPVTMEVVPPVPATDAAENNTTSPTGPVWQGLPLGQEAAVDFNGDGQSEIVNCTLGEEDDVRLTIRHGAWEFVWERDYFYNPALYLGDTLLGDGQLELYVYGDVGSDDYETTILRLHGDTIEEATLFGAPLPPSGDGTVIVETYVNVLGTWNAQIPYAMEGNFTFAQSGPAQILQYPELWEERALTLTQDGMPATLISEEPSDTPLPLTAGTRLLPLSTDEASFVVCQTSDNALVRLSLTKAPEEWEWRIGDKPESDWFEALFYAG